MTHRPTLESWAALLRPALPPDAELDLEPNLGQLRASWPPGCAVIIFIAPNAVSDYREAEEDVRALADQNLLEFVRENLRRFNPQRDAEFRIVVASIDFVPLSRESAGAN
jgi:hypothetical protein